MTSVPDGDRRDSSDDTPFCEAAMVFFGLLVIKVPGNTLQEVLASRTSHVNGLQTQEAFQQ